LKEQAERRDSGTGELAFKAGDIANIFYTTAYLGRVEAFEDQLPFHIARKKIPHVDLESGEAVKPSKPNRMKLEMIVFDVFHSRSGSRCWRSRGPRSSVR
jgi:UDP-N-acetylglucosamine/UDP-N-acetylgalactosamine diphosphorylase